MDIFQIISENKHIENEISEVMSCSQGNVTKIRKLKALSNKCESELAHARTEYYVKTLRKKVTNTIKKTVIVLFSLSYLIFTLFRISWYYHPENNPLPPNTKYDVVFLIKATYYLVIIAAVFWGLKKAVNIIKNKSK